jgi:hypothetical protein
MPIFRQRPKTDAGEFCRNWYRRFAFPTGPDQVQALEALTIDPLITAYQEAGSDPLEMDLDLIADEMLALRLELFGTAYAHRTREKVPLGIAETAATKQCLMERDRGDIWDRMLIYNQTIAAGPATRGTGSFTRMLDQMRIGLLKDYAKAGADPDCAVRAVNRVGTSVDFLKMAPPRLGWVLAHQAGLEQSDGLILVLGAIARDLYNGARNSLEEVDLRA